MRIGPVILLLGTAVVVGWIAPDLSVRHGGDASASVVTDSVTHRESEATDDTVLVRESDGHFYADAGVNAHRTHFLVDTGASMVALTGDDARAIGLSWSEADIVPVGNGANGVVFGVPVKLDRIKLAGFQAYDVEAAIIPKGLEVSLLGQSFLTRLRGVRIEGDRMTLSGDS
ncbi:retropepsin-like aspartic protease family protein [Novosphingobium sp.]|uniref:retropepsin-like aspartic protease family protein n=1 Tax=Novosphingobium sp. TaxID=1874826 RepID=UPI002FD8D235